jgi:archaellum component FlaC
MKEESKVKLETIKNSNFSWIVEAGIVDEQGLRISGNGIIIKQIGDLKELQDKTNVKLYGLTKDLEKVKDSLNSSLNDINLTLKEISENTLNI